MKKTLISLILSIMLILLSAGCTPEKNVAVFKKGSPAAWGDSFEVPQIKQTNGAPIIGELSKQALSGDSISIAGAGFKSEGFKAFVVGMDKRGRQKTAEAEYTVVDDSLMSLLIDKSFRFGVYGVYLENSKGCSNIEYVNLPAVWYMGATRLTAGDSLNIYGENLTNSLAGDAEAVRAYIVGEDEYCKAKVLSADPYKVTVKIPEELEDNKEYTVMLHTGHGGTLGFAEAPQKLTYYEKDPDSYGGTVINITDFGVDNKAFSNELDVSANIQNAIDQAADGDIIFFPPGVYFCNSAVNVDKSVKFAGAGQDASFIITGNQLTRSLFNIQVPHVEFEGFTFRHFRKSGMIKSGFIEYNGDNHDTGVLSLYIHGCSFLQKLPDKSNVKYEPITIRNAACVTIKDNYFEATDSVAAYDCQKLNFCNNNIKTRLFVGAYYGQNTSFFHNIDGLDISGNYCIGKDYDTDKTQTLSPGDMTAGRFIVIQGFCRNSYIAHNTTRSAGIPMHNGGELILYENLVPKLEASVKDSNGEWITLISDTAYQPAKGDIISIVAGRGKGQYGVVKSSKGGKIIFDSPLNVIPDTTSRILISNNFSNAAVYKNDFNGYKNYTDSASDATTLLQIYGGMHNLFVTQNIGKYLPEGICITPYYTEQNARCAIYWCCFDGNSFSDTGIGIGYYMATSDASEKFAGEFSVGVVIRRNSFENTKKYKNGTGGNAIEMSYSAAYFGRGNSSQPFAGPWINGTIIEHNTFKASQGYDIVFGSNSGGTVIRGNKSDHKSQKANIMLADGNGFIEAKY